MKDIQEIIQNPPFYDDFFKVQNDGTIDAEKYYRVLYRPGYNIQARELNQMQSILQEQVSRLATSSFKNGSCIVPGKIAFKNKINYVKIKTEDQLAANLLYEQISEGDKVSMVIPGGPTLSADILFVAPRTDEYPLTLYINYSNSVIIDDEQVQSFKDDVTLQISKDNVPGFIEVETFEEDATGLGCIATIAPGIYFLNGICAFVGSHSIVIDRYDILPTGYISVVPITSVVTELEDETLFDNAAGSPNFSAPGAARLKIVAQMVYTSTKDQQFNLDSQDGVAIMQIRDGQIFQDSVETTNLDGIINDKLAARTSTFEGDTVIRNFQLDIFDNDQLSDNFIIRLGAGEAYISGYNFLTQSPINIDVPKARSTQQVNNELLVLNYNGFFEWDSQPEYIPGSPDNPYPVLDILNLDNDIIGQCNFKYISYNTNRLFFFNLRLNIDPNTNEQYSITTARFIQDQNWTIGSDDKFKMEIKLIDNIPVYIDNKNNLIDWTANGPVKSLTDVTGQFDTLITFMNMSLEFSQSNLSIILPEKYNINEVIIAQSSVDGTDVTNQFTITQSSPGIMNIITYTGLPIGGEVINAIVSVTNRAGTPKLKTLTNIDYTVDYNPIIGSSAPEIVLNRSDIYKINSIEYKLKADPGSVFKDITNLFSFDSGKTANMYAPGSIQLLPNVSLPSGIEEIEIKVNFDYFEHSIEGDYFTVDSYILGSPSLEYYEYPLDASTLDFRILVDENFQTLPNAFKAVPGPNTQISYSYKYFLQRIDKICATSTGEFIVVQGNPTPVPRAPTTPANALHLYTLFINGYTYGVNDIRVQLQQHKLYTNQDISRLEKRIHNLEYYTSLSLLEKSAADEKIPDSSGIDRFKNGFVTDPFVGHQVGEVRNPDYAISIDQSERVARPIFFQDNIPLNFISPFATNESNAGYVYDNGVVYLPYTNIPFITQTLASGSINVNPYNVINYEGGTIELDPFSDNWRDIERRPDVIINDDNLFNAMLEMGNQIDVFGTVWNEWQTNWTGVVNSQIQNTTVTTSQNLVSSSNSAELWWQARRNSTRWVARRAIVNTQQFQTVRTTTNIIQDTIRTDESRTGIRTTLESEMSTTRSDRLVDSRIIPFIRGRFIKFKANNLKPNTRHYLFFDSENITMFSRDLENELNYNAYELTGEVWPNPQATQYPSAFGGPSQYITSNQFGEAFGAMYIPNTNDVSFRTGERVLELIDTLEVNIPSRITSRAQGVYTASGFLDIREQTVTNTRLPRIVSNNVQDNRATFSTAIRDESSSEVIANRTTRRFVGWHDPVAHSFLVGEFNGIFVKQVELFIRKLAPDNVIQVPLTVQIRTMVNGYPSRTVVPNAEVHIKPQSVNTSEDGSASTIATFPRPVYLSEGGEYCIVLLSNSNFYETYYAEMGEFNIVNPEERIDSQPNMGSFFMSQNGSTWTADQMKNMKFILYRMKFDTTQTPTVTFRSGDIPTRVLNINALYTENGSNQLLVNHPSHGFTNDTTSITISGALPFNGLSANQINRRFESINIINYDYYTVTVPVNANSTGFGGGNQIRSTEEKLIDLFIPNFNMLLISNTAATGTINRATTINNNNITNIPISLNENNIFRNRIVCDGLNGSKPVEFNIRLFSSSDNVSPILDTQRTSLTTVMNKLNVVDWSNNTPTGALYNELLPFADHTIPNYVASRYITRVIELANPATSLRVLFTANRPFNSTFKVFYRVGDDTPLDNINWIEAPFDLYPDATSRETMFSDYSLDFDTNTEFNLFQIKIVMSGTNTISVPKISDFRAISYT